MTYRTQKILLTNNHIVNKRRCGFSPSELNV